MCRRRPLGRPGRAEARRLQGNLPLDAGAGVDAEAVAAALFAVLQCAASLRGLRGGAACAAACYGSGRRAKGDRSRGQRADVLGIGAPVQRLIPELHVRASEGSAMEMSNQPFAACTESEAIGEGAGAGTLGSTPARWLVAFTAETMRVSVSYKYGSRSFSGASWATVSMTLIESGRLERYRSFSRSSVLKFASRSMLFKTLSCGFRSDV